MRDLIDRTSWDRTVGRVGALRRSRERGPWLVPIVDKCQYTFQARAGETVRVNLAQTIDSRCWVSGVLMTRLLDQTIATASTVTIYVVNSLVLPDSPETLFGPVSPTGTYVAKSSAFTDTTKPALEVIALGSAPIGPELRVFVEYVQSASTSTSTVTLGVTLLGRRA